MGSIHWIKCSVCGGVGTVVDDRSGKARIVKCRRCDGTGLMESMDEYDDKVDVENDPALVSVRRKQLASLESDVNAIMGKEAI